MQRSTTPPAAFNDAAGYKHIPLVAVNSSQVKAIGYDHARKVLAIQFGNGPGSVYHYPGASPELYAEFAASESKGTFFGKRISQLAFEKYPASVLVGQVEAPAVTTDSIAAELHGREWVARDAHIPDEVQDRAKAAGILIVCGASDDLVEFYGAWRDEEGAYDGTTMLLDAKGVLPSWEAIQDDNDESRHADYHARKPHARTIEAIWAPEPEKVGGMLNVSWAFETDVPHSTFDILEEGEVYCRGIVLYVADLAKA